MPTRHHVLQRFTRSILAIVVVLAALSIDAGAAWAASGTTSVTTDPALYPGFSTSVSDYVTRCTGSPVRVTVGTPSNTRSSVDGQSFRKGTYTTTVSLAAGQEFNVRTDAPATKDDATYYVRCLPSDFFTWTSSRPGTPQAEWYFVDPSASFSTATNPYVAIFDTNGVPVWWMNGNDSRGIVPLDAKLLPDGNVAWSHFRQTHDYEERTLSGDLVHVWATVGTPTDEHEMQMLSNGDALLLSRRNRPGTVDLSAYGISSTNATVQDAEIQEIAPNGSVVWSWNSKDHIPVSETNSAFWKNTAPAKTPDGRDAYDVYHANALEPTDGAVLLSLRHMDAIYKISRSDGHIVWKLGGTARPESLTFVGDPYGNFGGQHDNRVLPDGTVTVHDNGTLRGRPPRGVRYRIDESAKTATFVEQVTDPAAPSSQCCGSARRLPGGDWVASWGGTSQVAELTGAGSPVFRLTFQDPLFSYRANPVLPGVLSRVALRNAMDAQHPR